jgi:hypothetical protein
VRGSSGECLRVRQARTLRSCCQGMVLAGQRPCLAILLWAWEPGREPQPGPSAGDSGPARSERELARGTVSPSQPAASPARLDAPPRRSPHIPPPAGRTQARQSDPGRLQAHILGHSDRRRIHARSNRRSRAWDCSALRRRRPDQVVLHVGEPPQAFPGNRSCRIEDEVCAYVNALTGVFTRGHASVRLTRGLVLATGVARLPARMPERLLPVDCPVVLHSALARMWQAHPGSLG